MTSTKEVQKKPIPCGACEDYIPSTTDSPPDDLKGQCKRLLDLQTHTAMANYSRGDNLSLLIGLEVEEERAGVFVTEIPGKLLTKQQQRPCWFLIYMRRMASFFITRRGVQAQVDKDEIVDEVVANLMRMSFSSLTPTYQDFRRLVTSMLQNEVHQAFIRIFGQYRCGSCSFFVAPDRCTNTKLRPAAGQNRIIVDYKTRPTEVVHEVDGHEHKGCDEYAAVRFVELSEVKYITGNELVSIEDGLATLEKMGKRQAFQASILRWLAEGSSATEIAGMTDKNVYTIIKELQGTNEKPPKGTPAECEYHQAGAREILQAVLTGAFDRLMKDKPDLYDVVFKRDLSRHDERPPFSDIARDLGIPESAGILGASVAIERYKRGWGLVHIWSQIQQ